MHQRTIRDTTCSYWGVNFLVKKGKIEYPIQGFMHVKRTGQVYYEARVIGIDHIQDIDHIPKESLEYKFKTYLVLDKLEKLSKPIPTKELKVISSNKFVKIPPRSNYYVKLPNLVDEKS